MAVDDYFRRRTFGENWQLAERIGHWLHGAPWEWERTFGADERLEIMRTGSKLLGCCRFPVLQQSDKGRVRLSPGRCKHRMCPHCSRIESKLKERKIRAMAAWMDDPRFLTITIKSGPSLKSQIKKMNASYVRLRQSQGWKQHVTGSIAVTEIKHGKHGWHVHMHLLVDGTYWPQRKLATDWEQAVGERAVVDIRRNMGPAAMARYIAKYIAKESNIADWTSDQMAEYALATRGMRTLKCSGTMFALKLDEPEQLEAESPSGETWKAVDVSVSQLLKHADAGEESCRRLIELLRKREQDHQRETVQAWLKRAVAVLSPRSPTYIRPPDQQMKIGDWIIPICN